MILDAAIGAVIWIVNSSLTGLGGLVPEWIWDLLDGLWDSLTAVVTLGPVGLIGTLFVAHYVLDLGLNAYAFGINAYGMIPFKSA